MTTASQALTASFIQNTLPQWFIQATPAMRDALRHDMTRARSAREALSQIIERLQDLPAFARPLLTQALDAEFGPGLDVDRDHFFHARFRREWLTGRAVPEGSSTRTLLAAALQNFEAAEVEEADRETSSAITHGAPDTSATQHSVHPLNIRPGRFIELCRRLDLGGRYQQHLHHVLHPVARPDVPGSLDSDDIKARIIEHARLALRVDCHIARMKGTIDEAQYRALLCVDVNGTADQASSLQLLGCKLRGALLFLSGEQTRCTVYLPGEPDNPVQSYPSLEHFTEALRAKLRSEAYQRYFDRFIPERSKAAFFKRLHERLVPQVLHSVARGKGFHRQLISVAEADQTAFLDLQVIGLGGSLGDMFYLQQMLRIKDDARVLAVPTDDEDQKSREQRLAEWLDYGMDALNIGALFVPGLGETMMLVAGAQLLDETFEGVHAWRHGEMDEALDHLGNVAQNLALMGVMGMAGALTNTMSAETAMSQPPFLKRSVLARDASGRLRLNDVGVALRRLHPELADIDDRLITRIMAVSGVDEERLAGLHIGQQSAPAALLDTAKRFRLSQQAADSAQAFDAAYHASEQSNDPLIGLLRRDFPSLTLAAGQSLIAEATAEQRLAMLDTQRIPLEMAGKVRVHLQQTRMNRALEGFFLTPGTASADLQRLTLRSLVTFPGWPADLRIEIREGAATGSLLDSIGADDAAHRRVLIKGDKCFQVDAVEEPQKHRSLFSALLRVLPQKSRRAMGFSETDADVRGLKRRIFNWVRSQPKWAAEQLGQWTLPSAFRPPQRLLDGRIGYPLSGRGAGLPTADSVIQQQLVAAMTHLYPESVDLADQVRGMIRRGQSAQQLLAATQARALAYDQLHFSLIAWAEADDMSVLLNEGERLARRRVANALGRAWRYSHGAAPRGPRGLTLEYVSVPALPPLQNFYSDITRVELNNVQIDATGANTFLANFPNMTHLNVRGSFTELPSVLPQLHSLEHLSLENMPWPVEQSAMDRIMDIPALNSLSLAGTYLGNFNDTSRLHLSTLWINNTGLTQWPEWTHSLALNELDISDNHITEIPAEVIENPTDHTRHTVIYAYNNPFTHQSLEDYWRNDTGYGHRYQLDFDFPEDIREIQVEGAQMETDSDSSDDTEPHGHRIGSSGGAPVPTAQLWLRPGEEALNQRLLSAWAQVEQADDASHLLVLLQRLRETPDFRQFHAELASDVLTVLEAAAQDATLRGQLEVMANDRLFGANQTCQDGARLIFSDIQVAVYSYKSMRGVAESQRTDALLGVIRQLFRLNEVQAIADAEMARRESLGMPLDHAEVRLAYRIGLTDDLGLPGQPYRMAWARLAAVDRGALLDARRRVLEAERGPAFLQFAISDQQWNARLRAAHEAGLTAATESVRARMAALEEHPPADPDEYHRQGLALIAERDAAEALMLSQLTDLYRASW